MTRPVVVHNDDKEQQCAKQNNTNKNVDGGNRDIDRGWAWVVLASTFIGSVIGSGQYFNTGIYYYIFLNEFGESRSTTMWITASQGIASAITGIVGSGAIVKLGPRKAMMIGSIMFGTSYALLYFANSVPYAIVCFFVAGSGSTFLLLSNIAALSIYFKDRLNVCTGICLAGAGLGTMLIGIEIEWAVAEFGWRGAMLLQAGTIFHICICASTIYSIKDNNTCQTQKQQQKMENEELSEDNKKNENSTTTSEKDNEEKAKFLSDARFWTQLLAFTFYFVSLVIMFQILKDYVVSNGFSYTYSVVMTCYGMANFVGRISGGLLASYITPTLLNSIVSTTCGIAISMLLLIDEEMTVLTGITLFGLFHGLQGAPQTLSWGSLFGQDLMAELTGYTLASGCLPTLIISPLAGYIVDQTQSFLPVVALASSSMITGGLLFLLTHVLHQRRMKNYTFDQKNQQDTSVVASIRLNL